MRLSNIFFNDSPTTKIYTLSPHASLPFYEPVLIWALLASLLIANAMLLVLTLPLAPLWAKLLQIPRPYLYAGILFFATIGTYAVNGSTVDLMVLLGIGAIGFMMRRFGLPIVPMIVAVILIPRAETQLRRALQLSDGEISGLVNSAFSIVVYVLIVALL